MKSCDRLKGSGLVCRQPQAQPSAPCARGTNHQQRWDGMSAREDEGALHCRESEIRALVEPCDRCRRFYRGTICPCCLTARYVTLLVAAPFVLVAIYFLVETIKSSVASVFVLMAVNVLGCLVWVPLAACAINSVVLNRKRWHNATKH